jgi:predicted small secreted protein
MKKVLFITIAALASMSLGACATVGKGKGKGKAPVAPISAPVVTKG